MNPEGAILISPIGDIPDWMSEEISSQIGPFFGFNTYIEPLLSDIEFAYDENRRQYYSTRILERLAREAPEGVVKVLAITEHDLFIPILTHVYGEAQLDGKACIISISRLVAHMEVEMMNNGGYNRLVKEAAHELGHCFNLRHCEDELCVMHYCRKIEDVDRKTSQFCRYCNVLLADSIKEIGLD